MSTFSAFSAVDLDAVLDDFESKVSEEATKEDREEVEQEVEQPRRRLEAKQKDRENRFQERLAEPPEKSELAAREVRQEEGDGAPKADFVVTKEDAISDTIVDNGSVEEEMEEEEEDEVAATLATAAVGGGGDSSLVSPRTDSTSSSPAFESIYDAASSMAAQEEEEETTLPVSPMVASGSTNHGEGGARPKELAVPTESPPPYSEVDPMTSNTGGGQEPLAEVVTPVVADAVRENETIHNSPSSPPTRPPPSVEIDSLLADLTEDQLLLGKVTPRWVPDEEAQSCMICDGKFTLVRRRHHCRACGKVLCSACCNDKVNLSCMANKIARVCKPCRLVLDRLHEVEVRASNNFDASAGGATSPGERPEPLSPGRMQPSTSLDSVATATTPVGVLKRLGGGAVTSGGGGGEAAGGETRAEAKQVMFSDGIRPGGDLTDLDGSSEYGRSSHSSSSGRRHRRSRKIHKSSADVGRSLIPPEEDVLPLLWCGELLRKKQAEEIDESFAASGDRGPLIFQINRNLRVFVKLIDYTPTSQQLWSYRSDGLSSVGQDEIVLLLLRLPGEIRLHKDIFEHFQTIYEQARAGHPAIDMSYTSILSGKPFLGSTEYGGFLYIRHTFQSVEGLDLPSQPPFLFALLLTKWEVPWARVFPIRLKLRLGAEMRYYPAPIWSVRNRKTVYKDIGNTIMKLLCDFKNYAYSLPIIRGLLIQMELKLTTILIPKDRYRQVERALLNSNEPVLALGSSFSTFSDSHLVAVQNDEESLAQNGGGVSYSDYETQAINIMNKTRKVTGASFVIFNGALKASSGLSAKSSIVEDGIMVQVTPDKMVEVRKALEKMENFQIKCGPLEGGGDDAADEVVAVKWVEKNSSLNSGVRSSIDDRCLDGVSSIRLHAGRDYVSDEDSLFIRWTEVFLLANPSETYEFDPPDPMAAATALAKAICSALVPHLKRLRESQVMKLAVRITLDQEKAGYETGIHGQQLGTEVMNALDSVLVPIIHCDTSPHKLCLELIFHILEL